VTSSGDYGRIDDRVKKTLSEKASENCCQVSDKTKVESLPGLVTTMRERLVNGIDLIGMYAIECVKETV